jgi:hypothetical protein
MIPPGVVKRIMKFISRVICTIIVMVSCLIVPVMADVSGSGGGYGVGGGSGGMVFTSSSSQAVAISAPATPPISAGDITSGNFSRLLISPQNLQFRLGPGESVEHTFTVTNKGKDPVLINPVLAEMPYGGPYMMDKTWLSVSPS